MQSEKRIFATWEEAGLDIPYNAHGNIYLLCPKCSATRRHDHTRIKCLSVEVDKGVFHCWNCDYRGGIKGGQGEDWSLRIKPKKLYVQPNTPQPIVPSDPLPAEAVKWLASRGISKATAEHFGVMVTRHWFPQIEGASPCLAFPYYRGGELVNVKYRVASKKIFVMEKDAEPIFYGLDDCTDSSFCIIVEGEIDALACHEAMVTPVLSVPNGAPPEGSKPNLDYFESGIPIFDRVERVFIATDKDGPGTTLADELARRIGLEKCYRVQWPEGCKDANDVLMKYGPDRLASTIADSRPYPIAGIFTVDDVADMVRGIYRDGFPKGFEVGIAPLAGNLVIFPGYLTIIGGIPSHGKALALDTPIPTPRGWTSMGDIQVGDEVYDENGGVCKVIFATPSMHDHPCYRMTFSGGESVVCDAEHLWLTRDDKARRSMYHAKRHDRPLSRFGTDQSHLRTYPSLRTTAEIAMSLRIKGPDNRLNHAVMVAKPIQSPDIPLPIDPYVLGCWIGDGHSKGGGFTSADEEVLNSIRDKGYIVTKRADKYGYGILGLSAQLRSLGLEGKKHIPVAYLRSSEAQRRCLLIGLMDTDGYVDARGRCEYTSINRDIADGVFELVSTLGYTPTLICGRATIYGRDCGEKYRVCFQADGLVRSLDRKQSRIRPHLSPRTAYRSIIACDPVDSVPVRCIQVDSPSHLYLCTRSFIPTHNTRFVEQMAVNLALAYHWSFALFSPESFPQERHIARLIEQHIGKPFFEGPTERVTEEELEEGMLWVGDHFFWIEPEKADLDEILAKAKVLIRREGINGLVLDPWNTIESNKPTSMPEHEYIGECLLRIQQFARHHHIHIFLTAHPRKMARESPGAKQPIPDPYDISGSAMWYNRGDIIITVWRDITDPSSPVEIHVWKVRNMEMGKVGAYKLAFNRVTGRYSEWHDFRG